MGFTNATCYHTVHKNVNKGRNTQCHVIEHNRRNKTQSRLMTELFYPLCINQDTYPITHVINCGFHLDFYEKFQYAS